VEDSVTVDHSAAAGVARVAAVDALTNHIHKTYQLQATTQAYQRKAKMLATPCRASAVTAASQPLLL
jgi:hypothetical protein